MLDVFKRKPKKTLDEWSLPEVTDVPQKFRAKAEHIKKHNPEDYQQLLWQSLELPPHGGDETYATHHEALLGLCAIAVNRNLIDKDPKSDSYNGFYQSMVRQYDHPNPDQQVREAMSKATDGRIPKEYEENENYGFDAEILKQHAPSDLRVITDTSPTSPEQMEAMSPIDFVKATFNDNVLSYNKKGSKTIHKGFVAISKLSTRRRTIIDPHNIADDEVDASTDELIDHDLTDFNFIGTAVFDTMSSKGGRSLNDNVTKNPFLVFEMDQEEKILQERFVTFMDIVRQYAPLVAVIDSGGKSIHYWFYVGGTPKEIIKIFVKYGVMHGADKSVLTTKNRLVRMPNVEANEEKRRFQKLLYFDPAPLSADNYVIWDSDGFIQAMDFLEKVDCYYHEGTWYYRKPDGIYIRTDKDTLLTMCNLAGCLKEVPDGEVESPATKYLLERMRTHSVDSVFERVAGYCSGVHTLRNGRRILVRQNPKWLPVVKDTQDWKNIEKFLRETFHGDSYEYLLAWLASGVRDMKNERGTEGVSVFSQSHYLNIVGKPNAGKSFLLANVFAPLFGEGDFDATGLFQENNDFNATECANELLFLDDSTAIKHTDTYRAWHTEMVKKLCVTNSGYIHAKGQDKRAIDLFRRVVRLLNWEKIDTLPLINQKDVTDKVIILVAQNFHMEDGKRVPNVRSDKWGRETQKLFRNEIASFYTYLLREHEIPDRIKSAEEDRRFPTKPFKDPEVIEKLKIGSRTRFITDCIELGDIPSTHEDDDGCYIEETVDKIHRLFGEHLRLSYRADYQKMFTKPQKLLQTLHEMRGYEDSIVFESNEDDLPDKGESYWRVRLPCEKTEENTNPFEK